MSDFFINEIMFGLSVFVSTITTYLVAAVKRLARKNEANNNGTKCLLRVSLIEYHDKYVPRGYIPSYAYENYCDMYIAYKNLEGNWMIDKMKDDIDTLRLSSVEDNGGYQNGNK